MRYTELRCSEWKKRFSRQFATRHCTALCSAPGFNFGNPMNCVNCVILAFLSLGTSQQLKKNCKAVSNKLMRNARPTQQRRKLKCSLFPKRKFVKLFRRETCCLPLQVNCHILVELRFSDRSVQNREVYSNLTLSSPTQGLSVCIVQV